MREGFPRFAAAASAELMRSINIRHFDWRPRFLIHTGCGDVTRFLPAGKRSLVIAMSLIAFRLVHCERRPSKSRNIAGSNGSRKTKSPPARSVSESLCAGQN